MALLEEQAATRLARLVPIRHGRMLASPFAFLRGSAAVMARDLATTPSSGIRVQSCGDCHLANFGVYATPERNLVFDINDFDETLEAPFEWDVKRLAASILVAGRHRGFPPESSRESALAAVRAYRLAIGQLADQRALDVWYARMDVQAVLEALSDSLRRRSERLVEKARANDSLRSLAKLAEEVDGELRIRRDPPLLVPLERDDGFGDLVGAFVESYRRSLQPDRRALLERYRFVDAALKVVGVGSVGTRCAIALLVAPATPEGHDPLVLQLKEAGPSVLEAVAGRARVRNHGQRVVEGQRLMQAASDLFLGWTRGPDGRDYYWRQLRDQKGAVDLERIRRPGLLAYAQTCGWALARAHARASGRAAEIAGYVGAGDAFERAVASFAEAYADQVERDHALLVEAVRAGRLEARTGV